jgi:hypothetical protein
LRRREAEERARREAEIKKAYEITPWGDLKWCHVSPSESLKGDVIIVEETGFPFLTDTTGFPEARLLI